MSQTHPWPTSSFEDSKNRWKVGPKVSNQKSLGHLRIFQVRNTWTRWHHKCWKRKLSSKRPCKNGKPVVIKRLIWDIYSPPVPPRGNAGRHCPICWVRGWSGRLEWQHQENSASCLEWQRKSMIFHRAWACSPSTCQLECGVFQLAATYGPNGNTTNPDIQGNYKTWTFHPSGGCRIPLRN